MRPFLILSALVFAACGPTVEGGPCPGSECSWAGTNSCGPNSSSCALNCVGNHCAGSCNASCSATCSNGATCTLRTEASGSGQCDAATCNFTVKDSGSMNCINNAKCTLA